MDEVGLFFCSACKLVQANGIYAWLSSGKIKIKYKIPLRCACPKTFSCLPFKGWWGRVIVTEDGASMWVVCRIFF